MSLCQYSNIFGEPNIGVHSIRIFGIALVDFGLTVLAGFLIARFFRLNFWWTLFALLVLGIIVHRIFCVRTTINKLFFKY